MLKRQDAASTGHAPVERPGGEVVFGNITRICYNAFNAPVTVTDANGIVTEYTYNDAGCVTRIVRRDGSEVLSSAGPVSSKGISFLNDLLGTTVGAKSGATYTAAALSAFGEDLNHHSPTPTSNSHSFYTGKPQVEGLGYAFLMRNYRAGLAKWQTADPMGYPDGWNQLAYCGNGVTGAVDLWGCRQVDLGEFVMGDSKAPSLKKYGGEYEGQDYFGNTHIYQDFEVIDNNEYVHHYRNTKSVYATDWLHTLVEGFDDAAEAAAYASGVIALLPDPLPQTKAAEITAAAGLAAASGITWFIGKVLSLFDEQIEVWDGEAYLGVPYKKSNRRPDGKPYLLLSKIVE